ncbi:MAG: glycosyltransferase [Crocinitomicaceae bacterium]
MEAKRPIKVLRIINRFNLGGPTYNVTYLSAYLPRNFETKLIGGAPESSEGDALFIPNQHGLNPDIIPDLQRSIHIPSDRKAYKTIKQLIENFKPDIVHTHASKAGALGRFAAKKCKVPVIIHTFHGHVFHSYFGKIKTTIYKIVERYLAKHSTAIIAISKMQKNELVNIHNITDNDKVHVVNLGFDLDRFQINKANNRKIFVDEYSIDDSAICIAIIGRLTAVKNHNLFFKVIQKVFEQTEKKIHVFVIGDGELKTDLMSISSEILQKFSHQKITFTSWIKDVSIPLSRLDVVCLTSLNEGTPVSLIEAQASNVAVISTNVGGVKDIIDVDKTGIVVEGFDENNYALSLLSLIENADKLRMMKANGLDFVKEKFHYKTLCFNIEQLYLKLLNQSDEQSEN